MIERNPVVFRGIIALRSYDNAASVCHHLVEQKIGSAQYSYLLFIVISYFAVTVKEEKHGVFGCLCAFISFGKIYTVRKRYAFACFFAFVFISFVKHIVH